MRTFGRALFVALFVLAPTQAFAGPAEDAGALFTRWKAAYDANDNVAVAKLYATDAILHGTRSRDLTLGREAITKYFTVVVGTGNKVEFRERELRRSTTRRSSSLASTTSCATRMDNSRRSLPASQWFW
jgi:hypothetical protein